MNSLVFAQIEAKIGISETEFIQGFPNLDVIAYENTNSYKRAVEIYGIEDSWVYHFEDSVLNHIYFMKYNDEIDQKNFSKYLSATNSIIIGYTAVYGSPDDLIIGDTVFVDPYPALFMKLALCRCKASKLADISLYFKCFAT